MGRKVRDGKGSSSRRGPVRPLHMQRSLLDMLWRAGGQTYDDARSTMLHDSLAPKRGRTAGKMLWSRVQRTLRDVIDGRATLDRY